MPNIIVGLLLGVGAGAWVYNKMMHSTGGNTKNALIVAAIAGLGALLFITTLLSALS